MLTPREWRVLAADTNVLVRLLVSDDLAQQRAVAQRLARARQHGEQVLVSSVVLAELSWVLDSTYGYPRAAIADAISRLVETPPIVVSERAAVSRAVDAYRRGPAGFSDYLVLELCAAEGATPLLTFDRKLLKHPSCERP